MGDFKVALIKDNLGNWNVKSYDNNPKELMRAYTGMISAAAKAVADLAGRAAKASVTGGASEAMGAVKAAQMAAELTNQVSVGNTTGAQIINIDMLRAQLVAELEAQRKILNENETKRAAAENASDLETGLRQAETKEKLEQLFENENDDAEGHLAKAWQALKGESIGEEEIKSAKGHLQVYVDNKKTSLTAASTAITAAQSEVQKALKRYTDMLTTIEDSIVSSEQPAAGS
jgi:hypothetical protein